MLTWRIQPAKVLSVCDVDVVFGRVVVVVHFDQDVAVINFNSNAINVLDLPINGNRNVLSTFNANNGLNVKGFVCVACKEGYFELLRCWSTVVDDGCSNLNIRSW